MPEPLLVKNFLNPNFNMSTCRLLWSSHFYISMNVTIYNIITITSTHNHVHPCRPPNFETVVWKRSEDYLEVAWRRSGNCRDRVRRLSGDCLETAWRLYRDCLGAVWGLFGDGLQTVWRLSGSSLWRLSADCLETVWRNIRRLYVVIAFVFKY